MIPLWAKHTGSDDPDGRGVVQYLCAESTPKPSASGSGRERVRRTPPPEVLRGDPALMRQAIAAVPFQCRYSSAVLSFEKSDIDVSAFNEGDPTLRRQVNEVITAFEATACAGISEEHRPPFLWTTHTHTGRLELNVCVPRAILAGDGRIKSINVHPPGPESRALWDAYRDVCNAQFGWADPGDPRRARLVAVPNWILKIAAEAGRAGKTLPKHLAEEVGEYAEAALAAGEISSRADLISQLRGAGIQISRIGKDYITLTTGEGKRVRLRGRIFSESFTSPESVQPPENAPRLVLSECIERYAEHVKHRADFNRGRYGGPEWSPPAVPPANTPPIPSAIEATEPRLASAANTKSLCPEPVPGVAATLGDAAIEVNEPDSDRRARYKAHIFLVIFGMTLPDELLLALRWIDRDTRTVRLADGSVVVDHGEHISSTKTSAMAARLMIAEAHAKGWSSIRLTGTDEFQRLAITEAVRAGILVSNPELSLIYQHEVERRKEEDDGRQLDPDGARAFAVQQSTVCGGGGDRGSPRATARRIDDAARRVGEATYFLGRRVNRLRWERPDTARIKTEIDLRSLAAQLGFAPDESASDRNHSVMRHPDGTKVIIGTSPVGHWVFSSNQGHQGTAIDLLQWRIGSTVSEALKKLQAQLNAPAFDPAPARTVARSRSQSAGNSELAKSEWFSAKATTRCAFLEQTRGISHETLASKRFTDTFRVDDHHNAVFPYLAQSGLVGVERRNRPSAAGGRSFKAYTAGATPGVWSSQGAANDWRVVIVESPIDAMAHYQLSPPADREGTRYLAIRNGISAELLKATMVGLPDGMTVVSACDADAAGAEYAEKISAAATQAGREFDIQQPSKPAKDWNEALLLQRHSPEPVAVPRSRSPRP